MSRKGDCWDNAVAESFFGIMKTELVYHEKYEGRTHCIRSSNTLRPSTIGKEDTQLLVIFLQPSMKNRN
jgi:transposase InsO family protein